ncbi:solute carrier family 22 member 16-like [Liolophura sinensis]|uniref:solute carrier family 22 member 16-like n=1 Tax=Liolophura sinensis TaxID=3198878 RepID=UPI003158C9AE
MGFVPDQGGDIKASSPRTTSEECDELLLDDKLVAPPTKKYTVLDAVRSRRVIIDSFRHMPRMSGVFCLTLASSKLAGDRFVNFALMAAVELPSGIISYLTMQRFGRKATIFIFDGIAGTALIAAVALKEVYGNGLVVTALSITGKFGASAAFGSLFTYTQELYPTNLRSLGLGISSASARIGGMIAPFSLLVMKYYPWGTRYCIWKSIPGSLRFGALPTGDKRQRTASNHRGDREMVQEINQMNPLTVLSLSKLFLSWYSMDTCMANEHVKYQAATTVDLIN